MILRGVSFFFQKEKRLNYHSLPYIILYAGSKMAIKLKLKAEEISNYKFRNVPRGYDAFEVDKYLDQIIKDYLSIEKDGLVSQVELDAANKKISELEEQIEKLTIENEKLTKKATLNKGNNVTADNVKILKRIDALERYLYKKGINPDTIK